MSAQRSHETHVDKRFIKDKRHACRSYGRTPTPTMENTSRRAHKACVTSAYTNTTRMIEDQRLVTSVTQCGQRNVAKGPLSPRLPAPFRLKSSAAEVQQASQNHKIIIIWTESRASMLGRMDGQGWTEAQKNRQRTRR